MSLQALWERSMRTGVVSRRIGKGASSAGRCNSSGRMRSGWSAGWPMRNIHWLPRTERTLRRTWSARVWKPRR